MIQQFLAEKKVILSCKQKLLQVKVRLSEAVATATDFQGVSTFCVHESKMCG